MKRFSKKFRLIGLVFVTIFLIGLTITTPVNATPSEGNWNTVNEINARFENHTLGPLVDKLVLDYSFSDMTDIIAALKSGKINTTVYIDAAYLREIISNEELRGEYNLSLKIFYMGFNLRALPFNSSEYNGINIGKVLRQAIAYAIDKESLITTYSWGNAKPIDSVIHEGFGIWHNPNIKKYESNITKAKELLDNAGVTDTDGNGIRNDPRTGDDIEFSILVTVKEYDPFRYILAERIAERLQKIGFNVTVEATTLIGILQNIWNLNFTCYILGWSLDSFFPTILYSFFHSSQDSATNPDGLNFPGFHNADYDVLAEKVYTSNNFSEVLEATYAAQEILAEELPYIVLYTPYVYTAHRKETVGIIYPTSGLHSEIGYKLSMLNIHQEGRVGGTLYLGVLSSWYPMTINPFISYTEEEKMITSLLWDPLIQLDTDGMPQPWLARNWTITQEVIPNGTHHEVLETIYKNNTGTSKDIYVTEDGWGDSPPGTDLKGTVITWYLQSGLKWSDGTPLTAEDVNFTYYLYINYEYNRSRKDYSKIWKIEVLNETTVRIHIVGTSLFMVSDYSIAPLPKHVWIHHWYSTNSWDLGLDTDNDTLIALSTVGSGPFVWVNHTSENITLVANPYYWRTDADNDGLPNRWEILYGLNSNNPNDANADTDNDGLTNLQEYQLGLDPTNADTDGDGMPDGWEIQYGLNPNDSSDGNLDTDGDGLTNLQEYQNQTNATCPDTDGDGLPDGWEVDNGLNATNPLDNNTDSDNDGLTNLEEYLYGTDVSTNDTDGDGIPDGWEINNGLNATDASDAAQDPDNDGLTNLQEYLHNTNITNNDTDGDGLPDGWEVNNGLNATDASDAALDSDSDGLTNLQEYEYGTDIFNNDTDGDGMPDGWEISNELNATFSDANMDYDNDGLTNIQEYFEGTDPQKSDTDNDGIPDGWEVANGLNATNGNDASLDSDNDGLTNLQEYAHNTNPLSNDTDKDGMPDAWEVEYNLDPTNPHDAGEDPDGDGVISIIEFREGRNPNVSDTPITEAYQVVPITVGAFVGAALVLVLFKIMIRSKE